MRTAALIIGFLALAKAGPYAKRPRPVAETALVAASQWWLQERLLAVEMRVLGASKDVGQLAEETTREAYRLADEARVRVEELAAGVAQEARKVRPLYPQCANNKEVRQIVEEIYNLKEVLSTPEDALWIDICIVITPKRRIEKVTNQVLKCTHRVSDAAAGFEVSMTVQLNDARGQVWDVQEAMYYCEKFLPEADPDCLKRLTVEGLQIVSRLPDRVRTVLDNALASREEAEDRLRGCFSRGISEATEKHLVHTQRMRECKEQLQQAKSQKPGEV